MTQLVFIDTETTSLRADRRAWEIGAISREPDGTETEHQWFVTRDDLDLGNADLMTLKIGKFHERHPDMIAGRETRYAESSAMALIEQVTRGAHLVGAVVSFDAEVLANRMRANGICPSWHYHLIDVEALAVGCLMQRDSDLYKPVIPPWKSDELSAALGVEVSDEERHTALGDAKWAMRIYDAVMGS